MSCTLDWTSRLATQLAVSNARCVTCYRLPHVTDNANIGLAWNSYKRYCLLESIGVWLMRSLP